MSDQTKASTTSLLTHNHTATLSHTKPPIFVVKNFMATTPETRTPDSMPMSASGEYFAIISQLMAEKDRLIAEKDELVDSKDRLWREMYQMMREKIDSVEVKSHERTNSSRLERDRLELHQLRGEVTKLRRRNSELAQALSEALETDDDCEDGPIEDDELFVSDGAFEETLK